MTENKEIQVYMNKENLFTPNSIRTVSGIYMNIFEPTIDMINIEDIAHSLSMQCRFAGHLPTFYSVAQHSCLTSDLVTPTHKLAALLHDASEAYLLDIPSPIKAHLTNYKTLEDNLMNLIAEKFDFAYPLNSLIKDADKEMLHYEWDNIMLQENQEICWSQEKSKLVFLEYFNKLIKWKR